MSVFGVFLVSIFPHSDPKSCEYEYFSCSVSFETISIYGAVFADQMYVSTCDIYFTKQIIVTHENKNFENLVIHIIQYRKMLLIHRKCVQYFSKIKSLKKRPYHLYFCSIEFQEAHRVFKWWQGMLSFNIWKRISWSANPQ